MKAARSSTATLLFGLSGALVVAGGALTAAYFVRGGEATAAVAPMAPRAADNRQKSPAAVAAVTRAVDDYLDGDLELRLEERAIKVPRRAFGAVPDLEAVEREASSGAATGEEELRYGEGSAVPIAVEREAIETMVRELRTSLDRSPTNARLDLENRQVIGEVPGFGLDVFGSVSAIEVALGRGTPSVELEGAALPAEISVADLGVEDISTVISTFSTKFSIADRTRNDNLKLLASMIDGTVLQPGETFSFNELTGDRTLEDGFKMAHVITSGEMVDGMAGGSCQISTTLHGAAFFGGLDILRSIPHSRPSTYVAMGLDATVVANQVDLKLANPYDFPVVIHYKVARGEAEVELLGREKPFDKVEFERDIVERLPFETITREDNRIGVGHMVVDQPGYPGYKLKRTRRVYKDGEVVKTNKWNLFYRPVIEYARIGINPNPNLPPPEQRDAHGPKPASGRFTMVQ